MKVLLTCGGTAGHINPALAIGEIIRQNAPSSELLFVGVRGGKEADLIPREGYNLAFVRSMGFQKKLSLNNIKAIWLALTSPYSKDVKEILNVFRPDIVIGTGGYACFPMLAAASRLGIPTVLHESNAVPGKTVKVLQGRVDAVWVAFSEAKDALKSSSKVTVVGNPLRQSFGVLSNREAKRKLGIPPEKKLLLSFGGSLGAEHLNQAVLEMMRDFTGNLDGWIHCHVTGKGKKAEMDSEYRTWSAEKQNRCRLFEYCYDMATYMAAADLVICRAGAMTLSELAKLKKPAILVPSPYVAENHQYRNAKALEKLGGAVVVEEKDLKNGALIAQTKELMTDENRRGELSAAIASCLQTNANRNIWMEFWKLCSASATKNGKKYPKV